MKTYLSLTVVVAMIGFTSQAQNIWTQVADFAGGGGRYGAVGFSIGDQGYIGTGYSLYGGYTNDFWEYDPASNTWTQKASFGGSARNCAVGFSIGDKGYIGTGYANGKRNNDFWEYDPATNMWAKKANFGGTKRWRAVGFSIGNKGYIGTGQNNTPYTKDFWEYDPSADTWTKKADFGGTARKQAVGFSVGNEGYIGTGNDGSLKNDFWQYDPSADIWTKKADFGGAPRKRAAGFSIGTKGYFGTGETKAGVTEDFWEYDPANDSWTQEADFGGGGRSMAAGFSIGTNGYLGLGFHDFPDDFWKYTPSGKPLGAMTSSTQKISNAINSELKLLIFPNPGKGDVTIEIDNLHREFITIRIFDVAGKEVFSSVEGMIIGSYSKQLHLSGLPSGVYSLEIIHNSKKDIKELIISKTQN